MELFVEIIGWYGMVAVLLAYGLNSFSVISTGPLYQFLNLTGSIGLGSVAYWNNAYPPTVTNIIWGLIALFSLLKTALHLKDKA